MFMNACIREEISMPTLHLEHISKRYSRQDVIFDDLNLTLDGREFTVLLGLAECGESTLLQIIAGLEKPTSGVVYMDGQPVNKKTLKTGNMAVVFRNHALYPQMTVRDNIAYSLKIRKKAAEEIQTRVEEVADMLGLEELLERKPKELSAGQQQMVAIARALVRRPKFILLDEPLAGLDEQSGRQMRQRFQEIYQSTEASFLYATHDPVEAMAIGTRIIVLKDGQIQQIDTPENIYKHPANTFVAGLTGVPGMNFWHAKIAGDQQEVLLQIEDLGEYSLSKAASRKLTEQKDLGQNILVGVRPEHIQLRRAGNLSAISGFYGIDGSTGYLYLESVDKQVTIRVENDRDPGIGSTFYFGMEGSDVHLFDMETKQRIDLV